MRKRSPNYPKPQEYVRTKVALESFIPMDEPLQVGWRESLKLVPNLRLSSITNETVWTVDLYSGQYYVVHVHGITETCKSIPTLIGHLCKLLGISPKESTGGV